MREDMILFSESFKKLEKYVSKEKYTGWDPYDVLSSKRLPQKIKENKFIAFLLTQVIKYSPINFRNILGVEKRKSNKGLSIISRAYYLASDVFGEEYYKRKGSEVLQELLKRTEENCSSHEFYYGYKFKIGPGITDIICLSETTKTLILVYKFEKDQRFLKSAHKKIEYIFNNLYVDEDDCGYIKYTKDEEGRIVFNVSALVLETLSEFLKLHVEERYKYEEVIEKLTKFLLKHQRSNGAWPYSYYISMKRYYWQLDFHQGFIIDSLNAIFPYLKEGLRERVRRSIEMGINFYMNKQFTKEGVSYYRYPLKYPVDIHNQAQGIITFSKLYLSTKNKNFSEFACKIARWTVKNMQSPEGYFYTHKWPLFLNKIPYMRWGQAWMMLALATLLGALKNEDLVNRTN
jgi:hypothetical protein